MKSLLKRQIRKHLPKELTKREDMKPFLDAVAKSYENFEEQTSMIQRAITISSNELFEANNALKQEAQVLKEVINRLKNVSSSINGDKSKSVNQEKVELDTNELVSFLDNQTKEIVEMNIQRNDLMSNLAIKNQELEDYAHMVSHDLKSPLRNISALTSWLKEDYKDVFNEKGNENLNFIGDNVEKMDNLINGILDYTTIGETETEIDSIDLNVVAKDIIEMMLIPDLMTIKVDDLPTINGDEFRIRQLFQNLIDNAVKYNDKPKGFIEVGYESSNDEFWNFYVKDNGKGIEKAYHEKIFKTFHKLENGDSTGIGLSIIKKIVTFYGGDIWIESTPEIGTTFYFTLKK